MVEVDEEFALLVRRDLECGMDEHDRTESALLLLRLRDPLRYMQGCLSILRYSDSEREIHYVLDMIWIAMMCRSTGFWQAFNAILPTLLALMDFLIPKATDANMIVLARIFFSLREVDLPLDLVGFVWDLANRAPDFGSPLLFAVIQGEPERVPGEILQLAFTAELGSRFALELRAGCILALVCDSPNEPLLGLFEFRLQNCQEEEAMMFVKELDSMLGRSWRGFPGECLAYVFAFIERCFSIAPVPAILLLPSVCQN
jgi:hypothetical protein